MKFLLTSGGIRNGHVAKALTDLAGKPASEINFLFVPTAANPIEGDKGWLIDNCIEFKNQGFKSIDILDVAAVAPEVWQTRFRAADVVCVGGGDEQYLAKVFADIGMKDFLAEYLKDGSRVYMGISAGSMVTGEIIPFELMRIVYPEESFEELGKGLHLFDFYFIPHLNSEWFTHVRKDVLESVKDKFNGRPVYAFDDETALKIDGDKMEIVGVGDYWEFGK